MGRQVQVYLTSSDLKFLEGAIRKATELVILRYRSEGPFPTIAPSFVVEEVGKTWLTLFLARPDDLRALRFREVPAQKYWTLDVLAEPIVEFSRPFFDGTQIRRGRIYYQAGDYDPDGRWIEKPKSFLEWADAIVRNTKKVLHRDASLDGYLGPEALALHASGNAKLSAT